MFFRRKRKPEPDTAAVAPIPPLTKSGFFSTEIDARPFFRDEIVAFVKQRNFAPPPVQRDAKGVAMDSADVSPKFTPDLRVGVPDAQLLWYGSQGFIGYQACAIIAQHWLVDKACAMPGRDAVRHGFEITANDGQEIAPDVFAKLRKLNKRYRLKQHLQDYIKLGKVFGVRVALFVVDGIDYAAPFNPDGVKPGSYRGIKQIDPYWITPFLDQKAMSNPAAMGFYEPEFWMINGQKYHKSHLCIFRNGVLPDILKPTYLYGGIPVPQKLAERVYAAERTANEAPLLAQTKRTNIIKTDIAKALANQAKFEQRLRLWEYYRDNRGIKVADTGDEYQQFDTSLADLDDVIMTQYQLVAACADVPATKLLGTSPKGFNATGNFESASYHESLESIQENDLTPLVDGHHIRVIASEMQQQIGVEIEWNPVDSPTAIELADINLKKAQTGNALTASGAIDGEDERNRLMADKSSGYNGLADRVIEQDDGEAAAII